MYEIIETVINSGNFELNDIMKKIDIIWLQGGITDNERMQLIESARENAIPEASYAPLQEQIDVLAEKISGQENRVEMLESGEPSVQPPVVEDEWPEYKQPTGAHDAYQAGDKITYNGKHYVCKMDGCVWTPDAYPAGWELQA